jgi:hypothetical protein
MELRTGLCHAAIDTVLNQALICLVKAFFFLSFFFLFFFFFFYHACMRASFERLACRRQNGPECYASPDRYCTMHKYDCLAMFGDFSNTVCPCCHAPLHCLEGRLWHRIDPHRIRMETTRAYLPLRPRAAAKWTPFAHSSSDAWHVSGRSACG